MWWTSGSSWNSVEKSLDFKAGDRVRASGAAFSFIIKGFLSGGGLYNRLRGPNQWPLQPLSLKSLTLRWLNEMELLSRQLTRALCLSLQLPSSDLDHLFLVHYPPSSNHQGVGAHADSGFLTLLYQNADGLEFLAADGTWQPVPPHREALVGNVGEVLQLLTKGIFPATVHRVRGSQATAKLRLSLKRLKTCLNMLKNALKRASEADSRSRR